MINGINKLKCDKCGDTFGHYCSDEPDDPDEPGYYPKFPRGTAKSELLRVRVSHDEMVSFQAKAKRAKTPFPKWVRKLLTESP